MPIKRWSMFIRCVSLLYCDIKFLKWQHPVVNVPAKLLILGTPLFSWVHWVAPTSEGLIRHPHLGKGHCVAHMWNRWHFVICNWRRRYFVNRIWARRHFGDAYEVWVSHDPYIYKVEDFRYPYIPCEWRVFFFFVRISEELISSHIYIQYHVDDAFFFVTHIHYVNDAFGRVKISQLWCWLQPHLFH